MRKTTHIVFIFLLLLSSSVSYAQKNKGGKKDEPQKDNKVLSAKEVEVISYYYQASTQRILGNDKEAVQLYLECIARDPGNSGAYYQIAAIYNDLKQYTIGVDYAKKAAALDPGNKWYQQEYADLLIQNGKLKEALKVYDQLLKLVPEDQDYLLEKADILIYLKKYKPAIEIFDKLEKKMGMMPEISLQKQKLYLGQGNFDAAEKEMEKLVAAFPNDPEIYGMFAEFYINIRKKEKALIMFQKVLELDPQNPIIHLALANYYQENNDDVKSYEYIKMAFENPAVSIDNKIKILLSYYDLSARSPERKKEADELIQILIRVNPTEAKTWSVYGDYLVRDNKKEEAIEAFEKVIEYDNGRYAVWQELIKLYSDRGEFAKADTQSAKAIELFPSIPLFYYYHGLANYKIKNFAKAEESLITGKDLVINDPALKTSFLALLAETYAEQKKYEEADYTFESALLLQPNNADVLAAYAYYQAMVKNNTDKATEFATKGEKADTRNYKVWDVIAYLHTKNNNYKDALSAIENSIKLGGEKDARVLEHYGDILFLNGDVAKAVEEWKKAKNTFGISSSKLDEKIQQQKIVN